MAARCNSPQITGVRAAPVQTQLAMRGQGGVPQDATAVWLNLTVADPTTPTVLTAYPGPCGTPPLSSNVNARPLRSTASSVLVGLGDDGSVCVLHVHGQLAHRRRRRRMVRTRFRAGSAYRPSPPVRLLDTRLNGGVPTNAETPGARRRGFRAQRDRGRQHRARAT